MAYLEREELGNDTSRHLFVVVDLAFPGLMSLLSVSVFDCILYISAGNAQ